MLMVDFFLKKTIPSLSHGGIIRPLLFLAAIDILAWLLFATRIKTGLTGFKMFNIAKNHLMRFQNQTINFDKTTLLSEVANYIPFTGIEKNGVLKFEDGSSGFIIPIVGYASNNMFDQGKMATVDAFQNALRTADNDTTQYLLTVVSGQNVNSQVQTLLEAYEAERNEVLRDMYRDEIVKLMDYVDGQFDTLHQYILFKYPNADAFTNTMTWLEDLQNSNTLTFAVPRILNRNDVIQIFQQIFAPSQHEAVVVEFDDKK
ncbi:hypothetical protein D1157_19850 [Anaerotruncus sp. X29]|nr:hypothetical protein [Anaerotruncus sp. X29]